MPRSLPLTMAAALLAAAGCGDSAGPSHDLAGRWEARTFLATPAGDTTIDVISLGGLLTIEIDGAFRTTGVLLAPASLTGGGDAAADMRGSLTLAGDTVRFAQPEDTFVRYLAWTRRGDTLLVNDQAATTTSFTVHLVRD